MTCLDDRRLFDVHAGEPAPEAREHLAGCAVCAGRLRALRADLARIDTVLRETTPPAVRAPRRAVAWRWAPLAAAAVLALAIGAQRWAAAPAADGADDTLALADELSEAMATAVDFDDDDATDGATSSTCTWGDPLLGVGCDEPAALRIAWR